MFCNVNPRVDKYGVASGGWQTCRLLEPVQRLLKVPLLGNSLGCFLQLGTTLQKLE